MSKPYKTFEVFQLHLAFGNIGAMHVLQVCCQLLETPDTQHAMIYILCTHGLK